MINLLTKEQTVATPTKQRKTADLSRLRELNKNVRQAREDKKKIEAYIDALEAEIKEAMGDDEEAKIDGVLAFTYAKTNSFAWGEFAKAHPEIADSFKKHEWKEVLDKDALLAAHPTLVAPFRTRQFLVK
jgi:predicted transcriptional regulator